MRRRISLGSREREREQTAEKTDQERETERRRGNWLAKSETNLSLLSLIGAAHHEMGEWVRVSQEQCRQTRKTLALTSRTQKRSSSVCEACLVLWCGLVLVLGPVCVCVTQIRCIQFFVLLLALVGAGAGADTEYWCCLVNVSCRDYLEDGPKFCVLV